MVMRARVEAGKENTQPVEFNRGRQAPEVSRAEMDQFEDARLPPDLRGKHPVLSTKIRAELYDGAELEVSKQTDREVKDALKQQRALESSGTGRRAFEKTKENLTAVMRVATQKPGAVLGAIAAGIAGVEMLATIGVKAPPENPNPLRRAEDRIGSIIAPPIGVALATGAVASLLALHIEMYERAAFYNKCLTHFREKRIEELRKSGVNI